MKGRSPKKLKRRRGKQRTLKVSELALSITVGLLLSEQAFWGPDSRDCSLG